MVFEWPSCPAVSMPYAPTASRPSPSGVRFFAPDGLDRFSLVGFSVSLPRVKASMRRLEIGDRQPGVYLGSLDRGMPEHFLQMPDRRARRKRPVVTPGVI
jgi:hypothetical protein